ncbi:tetratricopeptide repeat protein [Rugamonas rivuli]|uniref:tetratricopeptide repeat protein n=1 Tax=Rugamonas rivuli TaxID=2743358 RepID=UPI001F394905|nr:tetratricopeptide repeat protein [Rugamonas rivuli]
MKKTCFLLLLALMPAFICSAYATATPDTGLTGGDTRDAREAVAIKLRLEVTIFEATPGGKAKAVAAINKLKALSESGDPYAQTSLAGLYKRGKDNLKKNPSQAMFWYRKAAEQGNPNAQDALGDAYREGEIVPKDYDQAASWYQKAAAQHYAPSEFQLSLMYQSGKIKPVDYVQAFDWCIQAAEHGHVEAQYLASLLYVDGKATPINYVEAMKWASIARKNGVREAVAWLLELEDGHPTQIAQARKLATEWLGRHPTKN